MPLCSEPPSHPGRIVPTRLTGLTKFLPREAERPRAAPTPSRALRAPAVPTGSMPPKALPGRSAMLGTGVPASWAVAFLPAPLSPRGQHQPEGGTRQPGPHPPFTRRLRGSGSLRSPSPSKPSPEEGAVPGARGRAGPHPGLAQPLRGTPLLPGHPQASPPERCHGDVGAGRGTGTGTAGPQPPLAPAPSWLC